MKLRKIAFVALLVALAVSPVFANGQSEQPAAADPNQPTTITLWYTATQTEVGPLPDDWAGYQILKDKFNIILEASSLPSSNNDQDQKIQAASAADQLPDLFTVSRKVFMQLAQRGILADLTGTTELMPNRTKIMLDKNALKFGTVNGKLYGWATPSAINKNEGLLIRKDWLDKLGLEVPKTLDDLYNVMYAFTYNDPDGNGRNDTYGYGAFVEVNNFEGYPGRRFEPLMGAFGVEGTWDLSADHFGLSVRDPKFYDFMVFLKKCIDTGVIDPNWSAYKKDDFRAAWKQGKFGIFREQNAAYAAENNYTPFDTNFPDGSFVICEAPIGPDGAQSIGPEEKNMRIWVVSAEAAENGKLEKIAQMFEWMSYGEGYMLCGFGKEGDQYTLDANGVPQATEGDRGYNGPIGQQYIQLRNMAFNYKDAAELASRYPVYTTKKSGKQMSAMWALQEMQQKTWTPSYGAQSMPTPSADLETLYQQGIAEFLTGRRELTQDNWNKYIAEFDAAGGKAWEEEGLKYAQENNLLN